MPLAHWPEFSILSSVQIFRHRVIFRTWNCIKTWRGGTEPKIASGHELRVIGNVGVVNAVRIKFVIISSIPINIVVLDDSTLPTSGDACSEICDDVIFDLGFSSVINADAAFLPTDDGVVKDLGRQRR